MPLTMTPFQKVRKFTDFDLRDSLLKICQWTESFFSDSFLPNWIEISKIIFIQNNYSRHNKYDPAAKKLYLTAHAYSSKWHKSINPSQGHLNWENWFLSYFLRFLVLPEGPCAWGFRADLREKANFETCAELDLSFEV